MMTPGLYRKQDIRFLDDYPLIEYPVIGAMAANNAAMPFSFWQVANTPGVAIEIDRGKVLWHQFNHLVKYYFENILQGIIFIKI